MLTDPGLNSGYFGALAVAMRGVRTGDITGFTVPTSGTGTEGGQSVVYLDTDAVASLASHLQNDTMTGFDSCAISLC